MAKIGDRFQATVAPKNVAGDPAPVTGLDFQENTDAYDLESFDGVTAIFVAVKPGVGAVVTASAFSKALVQLFDSVALPDVDAPPVDEEAVTLNLAVAQL